MPYSSQRSYSVWSIPQIPSQRTHVQCLVDPPDPFATNAVEIHVLDVAQLRLDALGRLGQQQIVRPARTLDEDVMPIDSKPPMPFRRPVVGYVASIRYRSVGNELKV